jgi:hypothetical protein
LGVPGYNKPSGETVTNAKDEMLWMSGNEAITLGASFAGARALAT